MVQLKDAEGLVLMAESSTQSTSAPRCTVLWIPRKPSKSQLWEKFIFGKPEGFPRHLAAGIDTE